MRQITPALVFLVSLLNLLSLHQSPGIRMPLKYYPNMADEDLLSLILFKPHQTVHTPTVLPTYITLLLAIMILPPTLIPLLNQPPTVRILALMALTQSIQSQRLPQSGMNWMI